MRRGLALILATASLAGCTTLGGTIRGDFSCRAAQGTCAPLSTNDAGAISRLADTKPKPTGAIRRNLAGGAPVRSSERVITVLISAHVDQDGVLHDAATVHVVAEAARWGIDPADESPSILSAFSRSTAPTLREVIVGASTSSVEGLVSSPARAPQRLSSVPSPGALEAARAGHRIARPSLLDAPLISPSAGSTSQASAPAILPLVQAPLVAPPVGGASDPRQSSPRAQPQANPEAKR